VKDEHSKKFVTLQNHKLFHAPILFCCIMQDELAKFQVRRREMMSVQRCEAEKIRHQQQSDRLQLHDEEISPPTVCWLIL